MFEYKASCTIQASAQDVWAVLSDASKFPIFDPNCERVEGVIGKNNKLAVYTTFRPGKPFKVTVEEFQANTKMVWGGGMPLGLFRGARTFSLTPTDQGVRIEVRETFTGLMSGLLKSAIPNLTGPFEEFVQGLKTHVEST